MKTIVIALACFTLLFNLTGCSTRGYTVSPYGDKAEVNLKSGNNFTAEIISVTDSAIFFAHEPENYLESPTLFYSLVKDIKSIKIQGYDGGNWLTPVLLFQVLPTGLLVGAAASVENAAPGIALISLIPAIVTSICFGTTETKSPEWHDELPLEEINSLKIYSRYPEAINEAQLKRLLKMYNLESVKKYF
jgi:hypothetical protein